MDISPAENCGSETFVIPSFVDAHCHFVWSGLECLYLDLSRTESSADLLELVEAAAGSGGIGRILRGFGFDESIWKHPEQPTLDELDRVTGNRPVFLRRVCCHEALVNSAMMELLPAGSPGLDRSAGIIKEGIALSFDSLFPPDMKTIMRACSMATELAYSSGVTAVYTFEPLITAKLLLESSQRMRTAVSLFGTDAGFLGDAPDEIGTVIDRIDSLKYFLDGSLGASTAAVSGTYLDRTVTRPLLTDDQVLLSLELASNLGLNAVYHAIGGRALAQLDRVSSSLLEKCDPEAMPSIRIEHAEELTFDWPGGWNPAVHSFVMQPNFTDRWQRCDGLYERKLGKDRSLALNPFSLVARSAFKLGFGSDGMPFGPLNGLAGATDHPLKEFSIDTGQAIEAYTTGAAEICGFTDLAKPLIHGRVADLTVLSADPFRTPWADLEIVATISSGNVVFGAEELLKEV
jgi:predicted amidohydrolase YtcJ